MDSMEIFNLGDSFDRVDFLLGGLVLWSASFHLRQKNTF